MVVEEESGVIVAQEVSRHAAGSSRIAPMLDASLAAIGVPEGTRTPQHFSADAGYCSEKNLALLAARGIDAYVATGRERHHRRGQRGDDLSAPQARPAPQDLPATPTPQRTPLRAAMRAKRQTEAERAAYARRKCITEPVHGLIKQARGFRQFLLRSLTKVRAEFTLVALTHNLLKLWRTAL